MIGNHTFLYFVVGIVLLHFLIGFGWLIYKIGFGGKKKEQKDSE